MLPRLLLVMSVAVGVGCAGTADPEPRNQERLRTAAAPLLAAHARLDAYEAAVAEGGDHARATALWPDVAADVEQAVDAVDAAALSGLGPGQRSTVVGYVGGLETALALWERVDAAIRAPQTGAAGQVDDRVDAARSHMRFLDGLRAGAFGRRPATGGRGR